SFRQSCNSILRCPSISDGRLSYQFSSDGYIRRSVYAYKSFIPGEQQMPAQLYQSPTGHELEIIPLSDISRFSEDVKLKVLYKTSPLAGAIMELDSVSYLKSSRHTHAVEHKHPVHKAELTFVTNEDGIVTVPSLHIGQWLAKVQNKKSFQDKSLCDETVDVATLSFSRN
uniref:DUF4198 domain-containing protein n=1 Tax=Escherichia coli TaxID=562 RepID=UPI0021BE90D7